MVPVVKSYPHPSQNSASAVFASEQLGHGWVVEGAGAEPPSGVAEDGLTGTPDGLLVCDGADWSIGAPHVSQ